MDDVYGLTLEGACRALILAHEGWDDPPELYFAYRDRGHVRLSRTQLIETIALHARAEGTSLRTPGEVLAGIAARCLEWNVRAAAEGTDMIGIALYVETVRVDRAAGDVAEQDQVRAYTRDRKLWTHPRAKEFREVYGLESGQPMLILDLPREGGQVERLGSKMTGGVPSGLKAIANAVVPNYQERD